MKAQCKTCGKMTNQPITKITRKIKGGRPAMPICKACYDKYRDQWDASDFERIMKSSRKTVSGRKKGSAVIVKKRKRKGRYRSPIYVSYDNKQKAWRAHYTIEAGKKRGVPRSRADSAEETLQIALDYCRNRALIAIDEELMQRYCEKKGLPYYPPQKKGRQK